MIIVINLYNLFVQVKLFRSTKSVQVITCTKSQLVHDIYILFITHLIFSLTFTKRFQQTICIENVYHFFKYYNANVYLEMFSNPKDRI